jgi:hypothetical protein
MKPSPEPDDLDRALRRLAGRSYGLEGIPMLLVLEDRGRLVTGHDQHGPDLGGALLAAARHQVHDAGSAGTARLIEWVADESFGPSALDAPEAGGSDG